MRRWRCEWGVGRREGDGAGRAGQGRAGQGRAKSREQQGGVGIRVSVGRRLARGWDYVRTLERICGSVLGSHRAGGGGGQLFVGGGKGALVVDVDWLGWRSGCGCGFRGEEGGCFGGVVR